MRILTSLCGLLIFAGGLPAAIIIDNFNTGSLDFSSSDVISQQGLDANSVLSANRTVSGRALGSASMDVRVNTTESTFSFSSSNFGYFAITYSFNLENQVDLLANGDTSFLLNFAYVDPGFWRGRYGFTVDGVRYSLARELFELNGSGTIEVPFSAFTSAASFTPTEIIFSADRVEPNLRLELSSITTIPEPRLPVLLVIGAVCTAINCRTRRRSHENT